MLYEGRLGLSLLRKAAENAEWVSAHGFACGGVRFYGSHWVSFDSENVDFDAIRQGVDAGDLMIRPAGKAGTDEVEEDGGGRVNRIRRPR